MSQAEIEYELDEYVRTAHVSSPYSEPTITQPPLLHSPTPLCSFDAIGDYGELVIQFGYVTLFVVAFPLAPLLALVSNWVEIRVDAYKILNLCCRTDPDGAQDIGTTPLACLALPCSACCCVCMCCTHTPHTYRHLV